MTLTQALYQLTVHEIADRSPAVVVVTATGEVDATNAAEFAAAIVEVPGPRPLIADLSRLDYLDSAGFAAVDRLLSRRTIAIVLDPHSAIRAAAKLIELPCHDTVDDAIAAG